MREPLDGGGRYTRRPLNDRWLGAVCVFAAYVAIARGLGNGYPFSTFDMYADVTEHSASRVLAREESGEVHELRAYEAYRCDGPLELQPAACERNGRYYRIDYVDREAAEYLADQATVPARGEPRRVDVVRRIWRFRGPGEPEVEDCPVATCRAVRR